VIDEPDRSNAENVQKDPRRVVITSTWFDLGDNDHYDITRLCSLNSLLTNPGCSHSYHRGCHPAAETGVIDGLKQERK
jgi:hypothetical protein